MNIASRAKAALFRNFSGSTDNKATRARLRRICFRVLIWRLWKAISEVGTATS